MAHEPALKLPNPWAAVGRDTEAGRALFALYNGFGHARSRGNDYSQRNRMRHLRHVAVHGVPEFPVPRPLPREKPKVKVPHFPHKGRYSSDDYHPVDFIPRRRRAADILQQIRDDSYEVDMPPMPKGPLLDDAEKARLQEVFYWSNRNLGPEPSEAEPVRRLPKKGSIEEQELLLNDIAKEIEDREAFLTEMEEYGKGDQYRAQIMFEIQHRVGQMKLLHENITQQEKKENSNAKTSSEQATPRVSAYAVPPPKSHARGQARNPNANLRFDLNVTGASLPHLHQDPRFEKSSTTSQRASQHDLTSTSASHADHPWTTTRADTPEPATVIKTASCHGNVAMTDHESQPPTPPPTTKPAPTSKKVLDLNSNFASSPANTASSTGSPGRNSSSSIRSDPRSRLANVKIQQNGGNSASSDRLYCNTSRMASNNSNSLNHHNSGSTPAWNECPNVTSAARTSPSDRPPDPQSRSANVKSGGDDSDRFMRGVTSNSKANFPSGSTPRDDQRRNSNGSDVGSDPSS